MESLDLQIMVADLKKQIKTQTIYAFLQHRLFLWAAHFHFELLFFAVPQCFFKFFQAEPVVP
jgi:hypothetical protein